MKTVPHGWRTGRVADFGAVVTGSTPPTSDEANFGGLTPFVTPGDLDGNLPIVAAERSLSPQGARKSRLIPQSATLIVCIGSTIGKTGLAGRELATNQQINAVIPTPDHCGTFVYYELTRIGSSLRRLAGKQAVPIVSKGQFKEFPVRIPPIGEQRAIAQILQTWDRGISATSQLIGAQQNRKRGLMQQLLTGRRRFKEFKGERWRRLRLGDLLDSVDRYITFNDEHSYKLASIRRRSEGLFFREELRGDAIKTKVMKTIRTGDFLLSKMQVVHGAWALVTPEFDGMFVSDSYIALVPRDSRRLKIEFLNYLSQTRQLRHLAYLSCHGVHIEKMTFNLDDFLHESIEIPTTTEEQAKIVSVLSTCDREINLLQRQLAALKEQKRGLMQKLLTGQVRVKVKGARK